MIQREGNRIFFGGRFIIDELLASLAALHQTVTAGFDTIVLDFNPCQLATAPPVLALCAKVMKLRSSGITFELVMPQVEKVRRLFTNANWAHLLDPNNFAPSQFKGYTQLPATQFQTDSEQRQAVNRIVNGILGAIPDLERKDFAALEWSVNEITDNVLVHSQSPIGGLVQMSTFQRVAKRVEYVVVDAGLGIPTTLRQSHPEITSDVEALDQAIREGVTRDTELGQGNGLFGTYEICSKSMGFFQVDSGYGKLQFNTGKFSITAEKVPFEGTLIAAQVDFSVPHLLEQALQFGGRQHSPMDFVELKYEQDGRPELVFEMKTEASSFGSRLAGTPVRNRLMNLLGMCPEQRVVIDFEGIPLISSSFADEVLGKLFAQLGPVTFSQRLELRNIAPTVKQLIDKAVLQRVGSLG